MQNTDRRKKKYVYILPKTVIINKNYYTKSPGKDVRIGLYYKTEIVLKKKKGGNE